jgi:hypothetical protein
VASSARPQSTAEEHGDDSVIAFIPKTFRFKCRKQVLALFSRQPIAYSDAALLRAFHAPNSCGEVRAKKASIGRQAKVDC